MKNRLDHFVRVEANDLSIKQHNTDKNIPCDMGDVDSIFYDLDKQVEFNLLERMYQDYRDYMRQQEMEEKAKQEKERESDGEHGQPNKLLGGLPPLDDIDDDLPEIPTLTKGTLDIETHINKEPDDGGDDLEFLELADLSLKRSHI